MCCREGHAGALHKRVQRRPHSLDQLAAWLAVIDFRAMATARSSACVASPPPWRTCALTLDCNFNVVEDRTVRWRERQFGTRSANAAGGPQHLARREVVHDHDVAGARRRHHGCFDIRIERHAIGCARQGHCHRRATKSIRGGVARGGPVALRYEIHQPLAIQRASVRPGHVRFRRVFAIKLNFRRIDADNAFQPFTPLDVAVGPFVLNGAE